MRPKGESRLETIAHHVTRYAGSTSAFLGAVAVIVVWLALGPVFHYSDTWQLVVNTGTTIVTFLMVFLIQRTQNKDALALQLKLNEIVAAMGGASNRLIDVEDLSETELESLRKHYRVLVEKSKRDGQRGQIHSVDETARVLSGGKPPAPGGPRSRRRSRRR